MTRSLRRTMGWLGCLMACAAQAAPKPAPLFSDHAVLQREVPVPVWGTAAPGEKITVTYRETIVSTVADSAGRWRVELPPMRASVSADLVIAGAGTVVARDVAVGDVWLLTGQSNMEWPLAKSDGADAAAAAADLPWLRHLKVPHRVSDRAQEEFHAGWVRSSPVAAPAFSAVGFFLARHLYGNGAVPVGLLNVSYGGTIIESWLGPRAVEAAASGANVRRRWSEVIAAFPGRQAQYEAARAAWERAKGRVGLGGVTDVPREPRRPDGPGSVIQPSGLYHGMLTPVLPCAVKGVLWYQGESNVGRPDEYADLLAAMIRGWRHDFQNSRLPFFVVQLPNYADRNFSWWQLRHAQAKVATEVPHTYLAVTIDLGESRDKHPRNKEEVGRRLALLARRHLLGEKITAEAPRLKSVVRQDSAAVVEFAKESDELIWRATAVGSPALEVAGADGVFIPATGRLEGGRLFLSAEAVPEPHFVRYLAQNDPAPCLFTRGGLPVAPFQSGLK